MICHQALSSMAVFLMLAVSLISTTEAFTVKPPTAVPDMTRTKTDLHTAFTEDFSLFDMTNKFLSAKPGEEIGDVKVIAPDFRAAGMILATAGVLVVIPYIQFVLGPLMAWLGMVSLVQTFRVRLVFDGDSIHLKKGGSQLTEGKINYIIGSENRWKYQDIVNYEFFPKGWIDQPQGPLLAYIKETTTNREKWNWGPGKWANSDKAIANGALPGQVHFLPALFNCKELRDELEKHGCQKL